MPMLNYVQIVLNRLIFLIENITAVFVVLSCVIDAVNSYHLHWQVSEMFGHYFNAV